MLSILIACRVISSTPNNRIVHGMRTAMQWIPLPGLVEVLEISNTTCASLSLSQS